MNPGDVFAGLPDEMKAWSMRETAHYNGRPVFFAYGFTCVQEPRLTRYDRYERKTRSVTSTWSWDGVEQASLRAALECAARVRAGGAP